MISEYPKPSSAHEDVAAVPFRIRPADVDAMVYCLNESPMCDAGSQNGIATALQRRLRPGVPVRAWVEASGRGYLQIGDQRQRMGRRLSEWLTRAMHGLTVEPMAGVVVLPKRLLSKQSIAEIRRLDRQQIRRPAIAAQATATAA